MASPSYYELLGVDPGVDQAEIKAAFRNEAKRNHPDAGGNPVLFHMIEEAYATLSDETRRASYDRNIGRVPAGDSFAGTAEEPTRTHRHFRQDESHDDYDPGEPTGQWNSGDWSDAHAGARNSDPWHGDEHAANWHDREPKAEPRPNFVNGPGHGPRYTSPSPLNERLRDMRNDRRFKWAAVGALGLWVIVAVFTGQQVVPGVDNMETLSTVIVLALAWVFGSIVLRVCGWLVLLIALWDAQVNGAAATETAFRIAFAACLWLAGHWLYAFRQGDWRSFIAEGSLGRLPGMLDPMWRWHKRQPADGGS